MTPVAADLRPEVAAAPSTCRELELFGVPLHPLTMAETVDRVEELVRDGGAHQHVVLNAAKVVQVQNDHALRDIIRSCSLINADGQSVVWAARLLGLDVPERVAGIDLMDHLLARAAERRWPVFFLGAREDVVRRVTELETQRHPGLVVAGCRNGYWTAAEEPAVVAEVAASGAALLFVAMPTPAKEEFLARNLDALGVRDGLLVVTRSDLADPELAQMYFGGSTKSASLST